MLFISLFNDLFSSLPNSLPLFLSHFHFLHPSHYVVLCTCKLFSQSFETFFFLLLIPHPWQLPTIRCLWPTLSAYRSRPSDTSSTYVDAHLKPVVIMIISSTIPTFTVIKSRNVHQEIANFLWFPIDTTILSLLTCSSPFYSLIHISLSYDCCRC